MVGAVVRVMAAAVAVGATALAILLDARAHQHRAVLRQARARALDLELLANPIPCALASMVLQAEAARAAVEAVVTPTGAALAAAQAVAVAAVVVAVVLEATQMAIHSADREATATTAVALIAGASGLVGKELLALLLADSACCEVHSLVRKAAVQQHPKLHQHTIDFSALGTAQSKPLHLPTIHEVYICLGTTIKTAGSQEAFRAVDFDAVLAVARLGIAQGATKLGVISAMGASASSSVFYSRVKGEMEDAVEQLGYQSIAVARPSFLAGNRQALYQTHRTGEEIALVAMKLFKPLIPKNYQAVQARDVAAALLNQVRQGKTGQTILLSGQLQGL